MPNKGRPSPKSLKSLPITPPWAGVIAPEKLREKLLELETMARQPGRPIGNATDAFMAALDNS